jgi:hypothetical protein
LSVADRYPRRCQTQRPRCRAERSARGQAAHDVGQGETVLARITPRCCSGRCGGALVPRCPPRPTRCSHHPRLRCPLNAGTITFASLIALFAVH